MFTSHINYAGYNLSQQVPEAMSRGIATRLETVSRLFRVCCSGCALPRRPLFLPALLVLSAQESHRISQRITRDEPLFFWLLWGVSGWICVETCISSGRETNRTERQNRRLGQPALSPSLAKWSRGAENLADGQGGEAIAWAWDSSRGWCLGHSYDARHGLQKPNRQSP